jgi:hypothetical protein
MLPKLTTPLILVAALAGLLLLHRWRSLVTWWQRRRDVMRLRRWLQEQEPVRVWPDDFVDVDSDAATGGSTWTHSSGRTHDFN